MTPPGSPEKAQSYGRHIVTEALMPKYAGNITFILFNDPPARSLLPHPATVPPAPVIHVHIAHRTFDIVTRPGAGYVTVADVLQQLSAEWRRYRTQDEAKSSRPYTGEGHTVGDIFSDRGIHFAGLTPSRMGPNHFDLHLA